ncbi:MAG: metallopeptidase TldD-related protein, partial [Myxococcota bacterium]|nr:metallopeptidase TldD-related protein [Myxococcota bacterium]
MALWRAIDNSYQAATRRLIQVQSNNAIKVARRDQSPDFSLAPVVIALEPGEPLEVDPTVWQDAVRQLSRVFLDYPAVMDSNVRFVAEDELLYLLNSEGTRIQHRRTKVRILMWAQTIAEDGMVLQIHDIAYATHPEHLPEVEALEARVRQLCERLTALRLAPLVDPTTAPAILRGRAAAVFFHEVLGHRVEGHRQKDEDESQTFRDKIGEVLMPSFLSVFDDPTLTSWEGTELNGHYRFDDEGVAAERTDIVTEGQLQGFLLSRSPVEGFERSNGHGRRQPGSAVVARQGNLVITASQTLSHEELRDRLLEEIQRQDKPFGLLFDDISGGFTFTGRVTPNAYSVRPVSVWKVYPDGREDELVRGVDLIGTPLATLDEILAASEKTEVFNGSCGAESGWV